MDKPTFIHLKKYSTQESILINIADIERVEVGPATTSFVTVRNSCRLQCYESLAEVEKSINDALNPSIEG